MPKVPPITVKATDRVAFVGKTQSGKTHAAGLLLLGVPRLLVLDPKGRLSDRARRAGGKYSWNLADWESKEGRAARESIARGGAGRLRVPAPIGGDYEPYLEWAYRQESITVYIDELYGVAGGSTRPGVWLNALYTRGAELGIGTWSATQRPANVPVVAFSEAEWLVLFRLTKPADIKRMEEEIGPDARRRLHPREFLLYNDVWDSPKFYPYIVGKPSRKRG